MPYSRMTESYSLLGGANLSEPIICQIDHSWHYGIVKKGLVPP
ncbi:hypothetical protein RHAB21_03438 [Pseudorhizobium halotolerans]|uniref:Uncharacterized protein n=1 Tax=Pseudorhizobium halotolerans TaxID=1233081 RepID=A0ABN7JUJ7_9HYPH|nr:hypothetical protein RHAB21_03438 [Pseudorhizobium halotolerans]